MKLVRILQILTFVLLEFSTHVWANPHIDAPPKSNVEISENQSAEVNSAQNENISITKPTPLPTRRQNVEAYFDKSNYYYSYRQEIEVHGGAVMGIKDSSKAKELLNGMLGFSYLLPKIETPKWVLGADLSFVGHGHLYVQRRYTFNEKGAFRPFYQYGLMHKIVPEDRFASVSNWENYLARGGVGFADIMKPPRSVQIQLDLAVGAKDILLIFYYGYSWGF